MQRAKCRLALRSLPGLERAYLPIALLLFAGLALYPGLRAAGDKACEEISAGLSILRIGGRDRRDRTARSGARSFPGYGRIFLPATKNSVRGSPRIGKIGRRWQLHFFFRAHGGHGAGSVGPVAGREEGRQLAGQAESSQRNGV